MFIFAFIGHRRREPRFARLIERHGSWLSMSLQRRRYELPGERAATVCWLLADSPHVPRPEEAPHRFSLRATLAPRPVSRELDPSAVSTDRSITVEIDPRDGAIRVDLPLVGEEHAYVLDDGDDWLFATDLRPLLAWNGYRCNPTGVASLLRYGMVPPPETIVEGVRRLLPGYALLRDAKGEEQVERLARPIAEWKGTVEGEPSSAIRAALDRTLRETPEKTVVYFSGGVDSGLIASRLAAAGRRDIRLVNYAFSETDEESANAERMAAALQLPFARVVHDESKIGTLCDGIGRSFSFPFNDLSVIPTALMIEASAEALRDGHATLLGVGADDLYSGGLKAHSWARVFGVPRPLRALAAGALGLSRPWERTGRATKAWSVLRRSLDQGHEFGPLMMHNDLADIGYAMGRESQARIEAAWRAAYDPFSKGLPVEDRLAWVYLINGGMGWEAPKFEPLRRLGVRAGYPFLDGEMLRLGFSLDWQTKCRDTKDKVLLQELLAAEVPPGLVDRPKAGFSPPFEKLLRREELQEKLRSLLLENTAPPADALDDRFVTGALDRAWAGLPLGRTTVNLLWAGFFGSAWVAQVRAALG